jgi:hypothetical protein
MRTCHKQGWSVAFFNTLSRAEQNDWLTWQLTYEDAVSEAIERAHQHTDGKVYAETVTARLLLELLRLGL